MHVAPREVIATVERVLFRRGFQPGAARPAAELVLASLDEGVDALGLLWAELEELELGPPAGVSARDDGTIEVDAAGASALHVAPSVLDLLADADTIVIRGATSGSLFGLLTGGGRERGMAVDVSTGPEETLVRLTGRCEPSTPMLRASLAVDQSVWSHLNRYANHVLAPASTESRADAGY
ncbi:MAG: hypothetical protein QOJ13_536 [Gaiellales bacterium]|nr:hypothetical protein [Gaiellales bacterium]